MAKNLLTQSHKCTLPSTQLLFLDEKSDDEKTEDIFPGDDIAVIPQDKESVYTGLLKL